MNCPKCGYQQGDGPECLRCGIFFARYHAGPPPAITHVKARKRPPRALLGYCLRFYRVFRWVSLAILTAVIVLILHTSAPPQVVVHSDAARLAEEKIRQFQSAVKHGANYRLELDEPELNGWMGTNLALKEPGNSRSVAAQTPESMVSLAKAVTGERTLDGDSLQQVQSSIRDVKVALQDDHIHLFAIFDFHGKDLSLELEGRLTARDGYLRLEPTSGKLGSLPLLSGTLRTVAARLFDSPENKEKFKLPSFIRDVAVENSTLIVTSR